MYLVACLAFSESSTSIQVWDLLTKKDIATVEEAHSLEVTAMVNYYPQLTGKPNPLECSYFATGGNDKCVKLWELTSEGVVRPLY